MAGPEPSEIYCAAAMCFTEKFLDDSIKETRNTSQVMNLIQNYWPMYENAFNTQVMIEGSRTVYDDLWKDIDKQEKIYAQRVGDMIRGISAAKAVKKWMKRKHKVQNPTAEEVYLTGDKWPKEVRDLQVEAHGFDAYNSSDIIVRPIGYKHAYFGVSLKKKPGPNSADPTLINKAFDTVLTGDDFDDVKEELESVREKYFAGLVKEAVKQGYIKLDIKGKSDKELFNPKSAVRNLEGFKRAYINTKGSLKMSEIGFDPPKTSKKGWEWYGDERLNRSELAKRKNETMRGWVNKQLADGELYKSFMGVMNKYADEFIETLIQVTLKKDLPKILKKEMGRPATKMGDLMFGFALVTGVGTASSAASLYKKRSKLSLYTGTAHDIHAMIEGLSEMDACPGKYEFKIVGGAIDDDENDEDGAAKVYFDLHKCNKVLLHMELRYKGSLTAQPQFFGRLGTDYKKIVREKCLLKGGSKRGK